MTVKELIEELEKANPDTEVSITVGYGCNSCVTAFDLTLDTTDDDYVDIYGEEVCDTNCDGTVNITEAKHDRTTPMDVLREKLKQKTTTK